MAVRWVGDSRPFTYRPVSIAAMSEQASFDDRLAVLAEAIDALLDEALADEDEIESFRHAENVLRAATGIRGRAAKVKARASLRLWRKDVSLSEVAQRLGISKQRADQLVRKARELDGRDI
jgi:hypothetical protein